MIKHGGLRHVAINVKSVEDAIHFYQRVFAMRIVRQPDENNAYMSSGCDNLALHHGPAGDRSAQSLDHLGFIVSSIDELEEGYQWAQVNRQDIGRPLRRHRDGSVSFYIRDPDGNLIQIMYEPSISRVAVHNTLSAS